MGDTSATDTTDLATEHTSMARGRLSPRLRLSPTTMVHTDSDTTDLATMVWATGATTTARGRLRPSLRLQLIPTTMVDTDSDTTDLAIALATVAMEDTTTARGRLRPSLRLLLTLTCCTVATTAMDSATATATVLAATGPTGDKLL